MYVCINFKAINNVLDAKMVLKTHLFIKIFRLLYFYIIYIVLAKQWTYLFFVIIGFEL